MSRAPPPGLWENDSRLTDEDNDRRAQEFVTLHGVQIGDMNQWVDDFSGIQSTDVVDIKRDQIMQDLLLVSGLVVELASSMMCHLAWLSFTSLQL
ncbi:hypothetical protein OCU04_004040 [Sclerotinia nivalis]|uniref:Uncharacterized protein n=1 Tax=Sclerotinia nivalis TaxID=352851 RepID=A0A9X0AT50_9HELO|nr:hypothetical protein OCU04_004040 [Sclerotinia nivalis]